MYLKRGAVKAGNMTEDELGELEERACPSCGSCSGMYTANSMNCLTEALGMLSWEWRNPAVYAWNETCERQEC